MPARASLGVRSGSGSPGRRAWSPRRATAVWSTPFERLSSPRVAQMSRWVASGGAARAAEKHAWRARCRDAVPRARRSKVRVPLRGGDTIEPTRALGALGRHVGRPEVAYLPARHGSDEVPTARMSGQLGQMARESSRRQGPTADLRVARSCRCASPGRARPRGHRRRRHGDEARARSRSHQAARRNEVMRHSRGRIPTFAGEATRAPTTLPLGERNAACSSRAQGMARRRVPVRAEYGVLRSSTRDGARRGAPTAAGARGMRPAQAEQRDGPSHVALARQPTCLSL